MSFAGCSKQDTGADITDHIHETITPVIQRETVQPTTVHTTQPIHQVTHEAPIVHEATTLPTISLDELRAKAHDGPHLHKDGDHTHQFCTSLHSFLE